MARTPAVALLALAAAFMLAGCAGAAVTNSAAPPPPPPPPPAATSLTSTTTTTAVAPPPSTTAPVTTATATTPPPPATATTPAAPEGLRVTFQGTEITFPDYITFSMTATGNATIESAEIRYGSDEHSLVPEMQKAKPDIAPGTSVNASWKWEMKKTGSLPPGANVWWQWTVTDADGTTLTTDRRTMTYLDPRFVWQHQDYPNLTVYWHDQPEDLIQQLLDVLDARLARIQLDVAIPAERKPQVFIYLNSVEIREAVLFQQDWTGALAFPRFNIILTAVNRDVLDWAKDALPHELTHLLVGEMVFGPYDNLPTWLNEGLAEYSVPDAEYDRDIYVQNAVSQGTLISLQSLGGSFPTDPTQAVLAYAESRSVVAYLIGEYGWNKMSELLTMYREGTTNELALSTVYGLSISTLETRWKASIGAES